MKKRVVIADDHTSVRQMLAAVFRRETEYEIVGEAGTGIEALEVCRDRNPDVMILDLVLPELSGMEVTRRLRAEKSPVRVLIYSGAIDRQQLTQAMRCKPDGLVHKEDSLADLREAVRVVANGGSYFSPMTLGLTSENEDLTEVPLTDRELEILQMIAESRSTKEIATRLGLAIKTVESHRYRLMDKLQLHDIAALTRYALQHGLVG